MKQSSYTYSEAYDAIIDAYYKDEIQPFRSEFCFCGTLSPDMYWNMSEDLYGKSYPYSTSEYNRMEKALFNGLGKLNVKGMSDIHFRRNTPEAERAIFNGMSRALEELRLIHIERGEDVDAPPVLKRRELAILS